MAKIIDRDQKFVAYLQTLVDDRAALAHLRRGLGQPLGVEPQMFPYVAPWLGDNSPPRQETAYYLIAALFAYHPSTSDRGNMGHHFADLRRNVKDDTALERRFVNLLAAHSDDLHRFHLRQIISYLKNHEIPVNWAQLLADIQAWGQSNRYVQAEWARAYWGGAGSRQNLLEARSETGTVETN